MKKALSILAAIMLLGAFAPQAWAYDYDFSAVASSGQRLYYEFDGNGVVRLVRGDINPSGNLAIPASVTYQGNTYSVTKISANTFSNCSGLTSVDIPSTVTHILNYAFQNCSGLTSIFFSYNSSLTQIGDWAFSGCSALYTLNIPDGVTSIGERAFYNCTNLVFVRISNSVTSIGDLAFFYCNSLDEIEFNAVNCTYMGASYSPAFEGNNNITTINIGSNVTRIPNYAFYGCGNNQNANLGLRSITIPNSVKRVGARAFGNCNRLRTVNFNADSIIAWGSTDYTVFENCTSITTLNIGSNVKVIPESFISSNNITTITIPNSVTRIGNAAFRGCSYLTTVNFNADSCTYMGTGTYVGTTVFYDCTRITTINIGSNVKVIPDFAFSCNSNPNNVVCEAVYPPTAYSFSFPNIPSYCTLTVPCGSLQYYNSTAPWSTRFSNINENCPTYTVTVVSANSNMGTVSGGGTYNEGASVTITATPNSGYRFVRWQDNNTQNPRTVTVTSNATYTAYFEVIPPTQYTITVNSNNSSWGTVSGGGTYNSGATATLTATPNSGYRFVRWNDNNTQNPRTVTVTSNATYTAYFEANSTPGGSDVDENCVITSFPYTMDFDGEITCWSIYDNNQDGASWGVYNEYGYNGTQCIGIEYAVNADDWLISPYIVTPGNYTVSWKAKAYNASYPETYQVLAVGTEVTTLFSETLSSTNYVDRNASFNVNSGDTIEIYFRYVSDDMYAFFIDNIVISHNTTGITDAELAGVTLRQANNAIIVEGAKGENVTVYDIMGRLIASGTANATSRFEVPATGIYLVHIGTRPTRKVVVM